MHDVITYSFTVDDVFPLSWILPLIIRINFVIKYVLRKAKTKHVSSDHVTESTATDGDPRHITDKQHWSNTSNRWTAISDEMGSRDPQ